MITYSAPYARMRALKGKFLGQAQIESLLQSPDVQSVMSLLSQTDYWEQVQNLSTSREIEHGLKQNLILNYIKILTFLRGRPARFVTTLLEKFDLLNLKAIIRSLINQNSSTEKSAPFIFSLGKYHKIPIEKALEARNMGELLRVMENTPYFRPLEIGYQQYEAEKSSLPLEIALDLDYYSRLQSDFNSLGIVDKIIAGKLLGIDYDIINLTWMVRFKEYHKLSPEQIYQYILPNGWKIQRQVFWRIIASGDILDSIKDHHIRPYDRVLDLSEPINDNADLGAEITLLRFLYNQSSKALQGFPLHIASFLGFFIMKEMEIRDIMAIFNGKSLGLPQDQIRKYLITLH